MRTNYTEVCKELGRKLRELRITRGWTQKQAAERLHVTERTYRAWEHGTGELYIHNLFLFARCYDIRVADLFFDSPMA